MSRKSRKQKPFSFRGKPKMTVGYIRLSVSDTEKENSIENQKHIIELWCVQHEMTIDKFYIDNGYSGRRFDRPAFTEMLNDIAEDKIKCVIVKDLSRLGRDNVNVGYYIEIYFPSHKVRFCSVNDGFETDNGKNNIIPEKCSLVRIPLTNALNEHIALESKRQLEVTLDMKAKNGMFIGPRAPFGYRKSETDHSLLVVDNKAAEIVKVIFEMAASGTGISSIVHHLNRNNIPTPIQYARENGLKGNYDDGNGSWNSRSVKNILTNRTYTGVLVQGKEKRIVEGTHQALVDNEIFELIQKAFSEREKKQTGNNTGIENILRGKVICGCCSGKLQRRFGRNREWAFFSCITNNRLGIKKCTGMYIREDDVMNAIYTELNTLADEYYISEAEYKAHKQAFEKEFADIVRNLDVEMNSSISYYERLVSGEISETEFTELMSVGRMLTLERDKLLEAVKEYDEKYKASQKLFKASRKEIPLLRSVAYSPISFQIVR